MVDQNTSVQLIKIIRSITDLQELYETQFQQLDKLHIKPADIPTSSLYYELSVEFDLLDDTTQEMIAPYMEEYVPGPKQEISPLVKSSRKIINPENAEKIETLLGIPALDHSRLEETFDQFLELYNQLLLQLRSIFLEGKEVDTYFGMKYYAKKVDSDIAFSLDLDEQQMYMMDYSYDEDVPHIFRLPWDNTLERAIQTSCYSEDLIHFYSVY